MKLNAEFQGVPNGEIYPITYAPGDECPPELEDAARSLGVLDESESEPAAARKAKK